VAIVADRYLIAQDYLGRCYGRRNQTLLVRPLYVSGDKLVGAFDNYHARWLAAREVRRG